MTSTSAHLPVFAIDCNFNEFCTQEIEQLGNDSGWDFEYPSSGHIEPNPANGDEMDYEGHSTFQIPDSIARPPNLIPNVSPLLDPMFSTERIDSGRLTEFPHASSMSHTIMPGDDSILMSEQAPAWSGRYANRADGWPLNTQGTDWSHYSNQAIYTDRNSVRFPAWLGGSRPHPLSLNGVVSFPRFSPSPSPSPKQRVRSAATHTLANQGHGMQGISTPFSSHVGRRADVPRAWTSQRSTRPPVSWVPDCRLSTQDIFIPNGVFWASTYECRWGDCRHTICRDECHEYPDYLRRVFEHFKGHAQEVIRDSAACGCRWEGCTTASYQARKRLREKIRHISTHLPWYTLCHRCAKITARRDAQGKKNPCVSGHCKPALADLKERIQTANTKLGRDVFISEFCNIVYGPN